MYTPALKPKAIERNYIDINKVQFKPNPKQEQRPPSKGLNRNQSLP